MKAEQQKEFRSKLRKVRRLMDSNGFKGIYLKSQSNFAWLSCGGENFVGLASTIGSGGLLVLPRAIHLITNRLETDRLSIEELGDLPVSTSEFPWQNPDEERKTVRKLAGRGKIGSDCGLQGTSDIAALIKPLRYGLHPAEVKRYRALGRDSEQALRKVCCSLIPGMTEYEIAGRLAEETFSRRMQPVTLLIAGDDRIRKYRHPIPTRQRCRKRVMLVLGARRGGLIVSLTRLVNFGPVPKTLAKRHAAVTRVDATLILNSRPGECYGDIFRKMMDTYTSEGFPNEWDLHHQGGPTGYEPRDFKVTEATAEAVQQNQAIAWNPSITGTKSEDTVLAGKKGVEILSEAQEWPMVRAETPFGTVKRPDILLM